jgi:hypothetical protein
MGRYYYIRTSNDDGNINYDGKFWFGVQSSNDFENIGFTKSEDQELVWKFCGCCFRSGDMMEDYCENCFDTREEHEKSVEENGETCDCLYIESNTVAYETTRDIMYDKICEMIKTYKNENLDELYVKDKILCIEDENGNDLTIEVTTETKDTSNEVLEKMARYNLCKIIKYIFDLGAEEIYVDCEF